MPQLKIISRYDKKQLSAFNSNIKPGALIKIKYDPEQLLQQSQASELKNSLEQGGRNLKIDSKKILEIHPKYFES